MAVLSFLSFLCCDQAFAPALRPEQKASGSWFNHGCQCLRRFVNALAFARDLLPQLWHWLGHNVHMPLEAPQQATRGWDVAALAQGVHGLSAQHASVFGVFCWCVFGRMRMNKCRLQEEGPIGTVDAY